MTRWLRGIAATGLVCSAGVLGFGSQAQADSVADGGLIAPGVNVGCPSGATPCTGNVVFQLTTPAGASGSVDISGGTAQVDLFVASADFGDAVFRNVSYSASIGVFDLGGGSYTTIVPDTAASVSGEVSFFGGAYQGFSHDDVLATNLVCGGATCGLTFGPNGFTGSNGTYDYVHTFNVTVPEPGLFALLGLGLVALARRARR